MKKEGFLLALCFLLSINLNAMANCSCKEFQKQISNQDQLLTSLEKSDLEYKSTIETSLVRGVVGARYYYCDDDHGFLLIKLHDGELLYKDVPLKTWFEFKFADSTNMFFRDNIKYNYITI